MPSDLGFKAMNAAHRILLKVSGGRLGWTAQEMPVLELTTTGRKTGQPRSVMLTSPLQEGSLSSSWHDGVAMTAPQRG